jgi:signal transduction histidine kinase
MQCRVVWYAWLMVLLLQAWMPGMACAADAGTLDSWRHQVSRTRLLAENDAPAALKEAQRLQAEFPVHAAPLDRARLFNLLSRIENYLMWTEQAFVHAKQAQTLAAQYGDRIGQAEADLNLALVAISQGQLTRLDEIVPHCMEMLEGANRPDLQSEIMGRAALMYRRKSLIESSVAMTMQALEFARRENDPMALGYAHWSAAILYLWSNRAAEARDHAMRMHGLARMHGIRRLEAAALVEWGRALAKLGDVLEAEQRIRAAIAIDRRAGMPASLGDSMYALAEILHQQGKEADAIKTLDAVVGIYETYPHKLGLWMVLHARSEYTRAAGGKGEQDAERAMALAQEIGRPLFLARSEQLLAALATKRNDWEQAYQHTARAAGLLEENATDSSGERMMLLAKRYEKDSEQRRIEVLTRAHERQQLWQRWMLTLLGAGSVILAGTLLFLRQLRRSHRRLEESNRQLQLSQDRLRENERLLRALAERNEAIREAERRHLAREVHDQLGQMLNVVRLNLLVLDRRFGRDNPEMQGVVGTMLDHLGNTIAIARDIVSALHPTVLDAGVASALDWLAQGFEKSTGIACNLTLDEEVVLNEAQSMAVYRIVQESLTNVARHSGADLVEISLGREGAMYRLEISDNGRGFDVFASKNLQSLGLIGMQERALMLGGSLDLTSSPGTGSILRMDFPVQREGELA